MTTNNEKRAKITVTLRPRFTNGDMLPLRIEEKTIRVKRGNVSLIKEILNNNK